MAPARGPRELPGLDGPTHEAYVSSWRAWSYLFAEGFKASDSTVRRADVRQSVARAAWLAGGGAEVAFMESLRDADAAIRACV
jgi:hypothetical protein